MSPVLFGIVAAAGAAASIFDLRRRTIPNPLVAALAAGLLGIQAIVHQGVPWPELAAAAGVLVGLGGLAAAGLFGWGDAKLAAALALAGDWRYALGFVLFMGLAGGALAFAYAAPAALRAVQIALGTRSLSAARLPAREGLRRYFPYAPAVAAGALLALWLKPF